MASVDMDPGEWLVTCGDGLMEALSIIYLFKNLPLKSWLQLPDRMGQGGLIGKTPAQFNSPEWENFVSALKGFAEDWSGIFSANTEISLLEAKNVTGAGPFDALVDRMDRAITALLRGADMATKGSAGNQVGASVQLDEAHVFEADDAQMISDTLKSKLSRYALAWKYGPDAPQYAYIQVKTTPRQDVANDVAVDTFLAGFPGMLEKKSTLERYGRPLPDADAECLELSPASPPPPEKNALAMAKEAEAKDNGAQFSNADGAGDAAPQLSAAFENASCKSFATAVHDDFAHIAARLP